MTLFFYIINFITDLCLLPFSWGNAVLGLLLVSIICSVILLVLFKKMSNQDKIKYHKNKIVGYIIEIALFRDQFGKTLMNQGRIFLHNLIYMRFVATPFLVMMVPVMIICLQLEGYLGYQPLKKGEQFIFKAVLDKKLTQDVPDVLDRIQITASPGIQFETLPLRIPGEGTVFIRGRILDDHEDQYIITGIEGKKDVVRKNVAVSDSLKRFSPETCKAGTLSYLLCSAEEPLPKDALFSSITIDYPKAYYPFIFWQFSPIIYFFILTLVFGLVIKPVIKVNI